MSDSVLVGIDVSSQTLEVASSDLAKTWQVGNDAAGLEGKLWSVSCRRSISR